jgi:hypothetical protein
MDLMIRLVLLLSVSGALVWSQSLSTARRVYLMPMSKGLDQYLANRLTSDHVLQVVTDPKLADVVFTDRIGKTFEAQWSALMPPPDDKKNASKEESKKEDSAKDKSGADKSADAHSEGSSDTRRPATSLVDAPVNQLADLSNNSNFGRAKGMVFLVNPKSHQVVWSLYELPKNSSSRQLDRTASDIVSRLKRDLKANQPKQ